ncbi:hypothetical protein BC629DRAFT_1496763, partial [Irpex lacteus]
WAGMVIRSSTYYNLCPDSEHGPMLCHLSFAYHNILGAVRHPSVDEAEEASHFFEYILLRSLV